MSYVNKYVHDSVLYNKYCSYSYMYICMFMYMYITVHVLLVEVFNMLFYSNFLLDFLVISLIYPSPWTSLLNRSSTLVGCLGKSCLWYTSGMSNWDSYSDNKNF